MDARERLSARLPASFQKARTAEAKAAYQSGTLEQWEALVPKLRPEVEKVRARIPAFNKPAGPDGLTSRSLGAPTDLSSAPFLRGPAPRPRQTTGDADRDGLPETLEEGLWQGFAPRYFISAGERNSFAFFASGAQAVITGTQATPPIGYYSVLPLFLGSRSGVTYGFAQVNYGTFWDRDDGLSVGLGCRRHLALALGLIGIGLGEVLNGLKGHPSDEEHAAALVAAPLGGTSYNPDPAAYRMYMLYTAAHEGEWTSDHSAYYFVRPPAPAGWHVPLYLSLSKHATYVSPPEGSPILQDWIIYSYFWTVELLFLAGVISPPVLLTLLHIGEVAFFHCAVEHFQKRDDGVYPSPAINVGAPNVPLNGAAWAWTGRFEGKLTARWSSRILRFLGFRYAGPPPGGGHDPDPDPDPPDRDPPDRDPIPRER